MSNLILDFSGGENVWIIISFSPLESGLKANINLAPYKIQ